MFDRGDLNDQDVVFVSLVPIACMFLDLLLLVLLRLRLTNPGFCGHLVMPGLSYSAYCGCLPYSRPFLGKQES